MTRRQPQMASDQHQRQWRRLAAPAAASCSLTLRLSWSGRTMAAPAKRPCARRMQIAGAHLVPPQLISAMERRRGRCLYARNRRRADHQSGKLNRPTRLLP